MKLKQKQQQVVKPEHISENPLGITKGIFNLRTVVTLLFFVVVSTKSFSQAKLFVAEPKKNFGSVKRGQILKNEFAITNTGNVPLVIEDVEVACSCTSVDFSEKPILPGQKAVIVVTFNTASTYGKQDRFVTVVSNDPRSPHKLRYKAHVSNE